MTVYRIKDGAPFNEKSLHLVRVDMPATEAIEMYGGDETLVLMWDTDVGTKAVTIFSNSDYKRIKNEAI